MQWHIITGEFPPQRGGVSDYTFRLAEGLSEAGEEVHVWTPEATEETPALEGVEIHSLPRRFGLRWLRALDQGLAAHPDERILLVQYVPHMYGWKAMNLAFCCWLARHRGSNVFVMFHEVAYPFKTGQPWKHHFLAAVHRLMAWIVLHSAKHSFTSIEPYRNLLSRLRPNARISMLRLFSNVPFDKHAGRGPLSGFIEANSVVGIFSNFSSEITGLLEDTLPTVLEDSAIQIFLIGPGSDFIQQFSRKYPRFKHRFSTSGRLDALEAGSYFQACDVLLQLYPGGVCAARGTLVAALASGIPVVTTAGPLTEPLLRHGGVLALADPNAVSIRGVIEELLADPALAGRIGAAGKQLYESEFDVPVTVEMLRQTARAGRRVAVNQ
ncbi:MAG: glycosyltransferase family 4 protein [Bryobacteraceae bacterium]|jgi:glycosyltransferase involved in cell wall biosynthesis